MNGSFAWQKAVACFRLRAAAAIQAARGRSGGGGV